MINCLDGKEDGDAPEKGGNGGGRPTHTGENNFHRRGTKLGLMDCSFAWSLFFILSPVGKKLPKEDEGYGSKTTSIPKSDQDTGDYRYQAEIVKNNHIDVLSTETLSFPPDHMLSIGGLWQEHWSRVRRSKICFHNPMFHLHHLVVF